MFSPSLINTCECDSDPLNLPFPDLCSTWIWTGFSQHHWRDTPWNALELFYLNFLHSLADWIWTKICYYWLLHGQAHLSIYILKSSPIILHIRFLFWRIRYFWCSAYISRYLLERAYSLPTACWGEINWLKLCSLNAWWALTFFVAVVLLICFCHEVSIISFLCCENSRPFYRLSAPSATPGPPKKTKKSNWCPFCACN